MTHSKKIYLYRVVMLHMYPFSLVYHIYSICHIYIYIKDNVCFVLEILLTKVKKYTIVSREQKSCV